MTTTNIAEGRPVLSVLAGRRYIIQTNLGRKLVEITAEEGHRVRLRLLRATTKRWTQVQTWAMGALIAHDIRTVGGEDFDLIRAADAATKLERERAAVSARLGVR